ncbi:MAG: bifunctional methylenetetrahydrofolate dehydrogenase/methenyltetrahydrofolate cyclohydrolase FolD [Dehalococcoidales bacterium]|jgi:methylenetetrahydrofolate dehydrogenase (NADP+)/methenyltetrahydrofolate cyclohydrolase|nr:bifunctional methylenetetrahydrofolate dehydrogenase/methenyltetrahydrofolate cyclohydrolase FolD [Dehalococcoidales bacterium]MDD3265141.1 bifunctional methylenetetrahydrofolate dehydrogenase/methenyltetrahydrofolate cyclohydrolase FolD [Dehalococcoidales bacterium]MDD4322767.1 bifunctional methylenetetrahydrofolate dehydrogenase/methenyltetrahydrofolate cyclohydrolase FolD [Dehalococcoidales bacterium]MDD4794451.1 bifunctional methylenetetrahydrofolate dehydrogenase/methenyltetrahydrofolate
MTARIIDGKKIAEELKEELKGQVAQLKEKYSLVPGLATVLVGDDPASHVYVNLKIKNCQNLGIASFNYQLKADTSQEELLGLVHKLNSDPAVHGILVQVPLPKQINETEILLAIDPKKDVDGFHPYNLGKMVIGENTFLSCTPGGIQQLLVRSNVKTEGAHVVVVGRSNIVGKPIANILLQKNSMANATVTVCHSRTPNIANFTLQADILIVAIGIAGFITADMVKEGATVIDVGTNRIGTTATGKAKLTGDVAFEEVSQKAGAITPSPGGVGPMTIAMLMANTVKAARLSIGLKP